MPFKKGQSGNPEGRPPGSPNKVTQEIRERINDFLDNNFDDIQADIQRLEPKDRVKFFIELLSFGVPRLKNIGMDIQNRPNLHLHDLDKNEISAAIQAIKKERKNRLHLPVQNKTG